MVQGDPALTFFQKLVRGKFGAWTISEITKSTPLLSYPSTLNPIPRKHELLEQPISIYAYTYMLRAPFLPREFALWDSEALSHYSGGETCARAGGYPCSIESLN